MTLSKMSFKTFTWPNNPKKYEIAFARKMSVDAVPFGTYVMKDMGMDYRIFRGEGEFVESAYDTFKKLASLFYKGTPGALIHPVWQSNNVYFVKLKLSQEPTENYVSYSFEFWESAVLPEQLKEVISNSAPQTSVQSERKAYTVKSGDTLWSIATDNGLSVDEIISLNPQIANPSRIYPGDKVYLS